MDIPIELCGAIREIHQIQGLRSIAPVYEGSVVGICLFTNEYQVTGNGALWLRLAGNIPEEAVVDIRKFGGQSHAQPSRGGQENALFTIEWQSAADVILKIEFSQIAAPNRALNFRYK